MRDIKGPASKTLRKAGGHTAFSSVDGPNPSELEEVVPRIDVSHRRRAQGLSETPERVQAEHGNGVVTVRLAKSESARPKRIQVKST